MENFLLPYLGQIDINNLEEDYDISIELNGEPINIDLNFKETKIDLSTANTINNFLTNINFYNSQNKKLIEENYNTKNENTLVKEYIEFHITELERDKLAEFIDFNDSTIKPEIQLLQKLKLVRVGLYPDGAHKSENFAAFDYTIDKKITDQLIVINVDEQNRLNDITWES